LSRRERTRRRIKASKRVKLAERSGFAARTQGDRETREAVSRGRPSGLRRRSEERAERELIVVRGSRQLRASVGVGETGGDKVRVAAFQHVGG
jgi:hypothetical protein